MTNYKYYYFPHRGIGEPARMVMHYAKVQFEDIRVPYDEWPGKHEKSKQNYLLHFFVYRNASGHNASFGH